MKRLLLLILTIILNFSLTAIFVGCGSNNDNLQGKTTQSVLTEMETEFNDAEKIILDKLEIVHAQLGTKYSTFVLNQQKLYDWFSFQQNKSSELMEKVKDLSIIYFKVVAKTIDNTNKDAIDAALNDFKVKVLDKSGLFSNYYNNTNTVPFSDIDTKYYNGSLNRNSADGGKNPNCDFKSYEEWVEVWRGLETKQKIAKADSYGIYVNALNEVKANYDKVKTAFESGNFNVDNILSNQ